MSGAALRAETAGDWTAQASAIAASALANPAAPAPLFYRIGPVTLILDCDVLEVAADLADAYADCRVDRAHGATLTCRVRDAGPDFTALEFDDSRIGLFDLALALVRPRAELAHLTEVAASEPGWRVIGNGCGSRRPLAAAEATRIVVNVAVQSEEFLVNLIVGAAQRADPAMLYVHAGGLAIGGRGVLICGRSGAGKSTTSATLGARGHPMLGDETVGVNLDDLSLWPFRRTMKLRPGPLPPGMRDRLNHTPTTLRTDAHGIGCTWVRAGQLFAANERVETVPLHSVFFLRRFCDVPYIERFTPSLADLAELQTLTQSLSAVVSWPAGDAARLLRYARVVAMLGRVNCYSVVLGTPADTAEHIEQLVRDH